MRLKLLITFICFIFMPCVLCRDCGSYDSVKHLAINLNDRIRDNASHQKDNGGAASLHNSKTDFGSRTHKCGATLISDRFLITAAHCMTDSDKPIAISIGRYDLNENPEPSQNTYEIQEVWIHPDYKSSVPKYADYNDIAVLMTDRKVNYNYNVWPYCLPPPNRIYRDYALVKIAGWGHVDQSYVPSSTIKTAHVKLMKNSRCESEWRRTAPDYYNDVITRINYPQGLTQQVICGAREGVDACGGDSGGPMTYQNNEGFYTVIGLIAKGIACADNPIYPGFYTNVAHYTDWIYATTGLPRQLATSNLPQPRPRPPIRRFTTQATTSWSQPTTRSTTWKPQTTPYIFGTWNTHTTSRPTTTWKPQTTPSSATPWKPHTTTSRSTFEIQPRPSLGTSPLHSQNAICPSLTGTFADPDPTICDEYYTCANGIPTKKFCDSDLYFDEKIGICNWKRDVHRQNCKNRVVLNKNGQPCEDFSHDSFSNQYKCGEDVLHEFLQRNPGLLAGIQSDPYDYDYDTFVRDNCIFPFTYLGTEFYECAPGTDQPFPWCATSLDVDGKNMKTWDICNSTGLGYPGNTPSNFNNPNIGRPNAFNSGLGQPGFGGGQSGFGQPGFGQQGFGGSQSGFGQPTVTKQGMCPPILFCPPTKGFAPPTTCSSDGACSGFDKCCFDRCLQHHTCQPPIGLGRR